MQDLDRYSRIGRKRRREEEQYARQSRLPQVDTIRGKGWQAWGDTKDDVLAGSGSFNWNLLPPPKGDVRLDVTRIDGVEFAIAVPTR
jgi:hypothetical protein